MQVAVASDHHSYPAPANNSSLFYVYVWHSANGTPFYVGKGTGKRAREISRRTADFRAVHAEGGCYVEIVDEFILESQAHAYEIELIALYGRRECGGLLVNKTDGGEGSSGFVHSDETRTKLSAMRTGTIDTDETREKKSAWQRGRTLTEEHRANLSIAQSNRSTEHSAKMADANRTRAPLPGYFKGVRERLGKWSARIIVDGKRSYLGTFASATEAAIAYDAAAISARPDSCYLNFTQEDGMRSHINILESVDAAFGRGLEPKPYLVPPVAANDNAIQVGPRVVGIMGYAGSGKTTVANILRERHGYKGPHIKRPLVHMAETLLYHLGIAPAEIVSYLDGAKKRDVIPELGISGTELQQQIGSWGRSVREDLWLSAWCVAADRILNKGGRVVQESVRHTNEADSIRARGGMIVLIERPGVGRLNDHESENIPTDPDAIIHNSGSVVDLRGRVADLVAA